MSVMVARRKECRRTVALNTFSRRTAVVMGLAALCGSAAAAMGRRSSSGPALWAAPGEFSTVYLFGQMPVGPETQWLSTSAQRAFSDSRELWVENPEFDPAAFDEFSQMMSAVKVDENFTVMDELDARDRSRLQALLESAGETAGALQGQSATYAYLMVSQIVDALVGAEASAMPEAEFRRRAQANGLPVHSEWADMRSFLEASVNLPHVVEIDLIRMRLDDADRVSQRPAELALWLEGDLSGMVAVNEFRRERYPELYQHILVDRNIAWADEIRSMLSGHGTRFVCIGFGHLVGPDSIQAQLLASGVEVHRV